MHLWTFHFSVVLQFGGVHSILVGFKFLQSEESIIFNPVSVFTAFNETGLVNATLFEFSSVTIYSVWESSS